ncbi:MAG TPA: transporter [Candidatus Acidoferrales bacterium]|nr:transporter [Candidatus Acidoferrales bacterium]
MINANFTRALVIAVGLIQFAWLLVPARLFAARPLVVDDAPTVPRGNLEIELGVSYAAAAHSTREQGLPVIGIAYGVFERLEAGIALQRVKNDSRGSAPVEGFEDLHLAAKYNLIEERATFPALSLALDIKAPTASRRKGLSSGRWDESFLFIATKSFAPLVFHLNAGYVIVDSPPGGKLKNIIRGGFAFEWPFRERWVLVGEIFGSSRPAAGEPNEAAFQVGFRYLLNPAFVLDAAGGRSLRSTGAEFQITSGFTWLFDLYQFLGGLR